MSGHNYIEYEETTGLSYTNQRSESFSTTKEISLKVGTVLPKGLAVGGSVSRSTTSGSTASSAA